MDITRDRSRRNVVRAASSLTLLLGFLAAFTLLPLTAANAAYNYTTVMQYPYILISEGHNGTATTQIPIPAGLTPTRFTGTVHTDGTAGGTVSVKVGEDTVLLDAKTGGPVSINLLTRPTSGYLTVSLSNQYLPETQYCTINDITTQTLDLMAVTYAGNATPPVSVSEFFTPDVTAVAVTAPASIATDLPAANAVLQMFASLGNIYPTNVPITFGETAAISGSTARIVRVNPTRDADVSVTVGTLNGTPLLTISGPSNKLSAAALAFATDSMPLASAPTVSGLQADAKFSPQRTVTLDSYGTGNISLQGIGTVSSTIGVDQVRFAPPVSEYTFHIAGTSTPVSATTQARVSLLWNDTLIASAQLSTADTWVLDATIPNPVRTGQLRTVLEAADTKGNCSGKGLPVRIDVNTLTSTITGVAGQGLPPGFARFPQIMYPDMPVVFGTTLPTMMRIDSASQLVLALAKINPTIITITSVNLQTVIDRNLPAVVVGASTDDANALMAPLRMYPLRTVDAAGENYMVTVDKPFAALEAYESGGRNLLVLANTAGGEQIANSLTHSINAFPYGWSSMEQELYVATSTTQKPFFLSVANIVPQSIVINEFRSVPLWLIPLAIILIFALIVRVIYVRARKKRFTAYANAFTDPTDETIPPDNDSRLPEE